MSLFKNMLIALSLVVSAAAVTAPAASAQGTTVVMIDEGRILSDSKAGKDIQTKLKNLETQMKNELEPTRATLETDGKALQAKAFAQKRQTVSQEFQLTERQALIDFNKAIEPVLMDVVKEKNAQVVMSKSQVIYSVDAIDVSASVISKLDAKTPTIAVTRQRAPAQPAQ